MVNVVHRRLFVCWKTTTNLCERSAPA